MAKKKRRRRRFRPWKFLFTLLLLAVIALIPLYFFGIIYPDGAEAGEYPNQDWMASVEGNRPISTLNIPGTDASASRYVFPFVTKQSQDTSLNEQMKNGYRVFELNVRVEGNSDGEYQKLVLCDGSSDCRQSAYFLDTGISLSDAVIAAREFMNAHPSETIIYIVTQAFEKDDPAVIEQLVSNLIEKNHNLFYTSNRIPNLDSVRGKIVLCRRYADALELGENFSGMNFTWQDQAGKTILANPAEQFYINTQDAVMVQDRYNYDKDNKWNAVRSLLDQPSAQEHVLVFNSLGCRGGMIPFVRLNAKSLNENFRNYTLTEGAPYGMILFHFADSTLADQVIRSNTLIPKEEPPAEEAPAEEAPAEEAPPAE